MSKKGYGTTIESLPITRETTCLVLSFWPWHPGRGKKGKHLEQMAQDGLDASSASPLATEKNRSAKSTRVSNKKDVSERKQEEPFCKE